MTLNDFTTEATTIEQQIMDVKAYAAANVKRFNWALLSAMTDQELIEAIGKRKNSRGAILAVFDALKGRAAAAPAAETPQPEPTPEAEAPAPALAPVIDEVAARRQKRSADRKRQRAAKKLANA